MLPRHELQPTRLCRYGLTSAGSSRLRPRSLGARCDWRNVIALPLLPAQAPQPLEKDLPLCGSVSVVQRFLDCVDFRGAHS